jgi:methionyl-tRNA formyltransferase
MRKARMIIETIKFWSIEAAERLRRSFSAWQVKVIITKNELTEKVLNRFKPEYVFFPYWSRKIPESVYQEFNRIRFHMVVKDMEMKAGVKYAESFQVTKKVS